MNTDRKAILRVLAALLLGQLRTLGGIAIACSAGREETYEHLIALESEGLVEWAPHGWRLTEKGRNHVETRMVA